MPANFLDGQKHKKHVGHQVQCGEELGRNTSGSDIMVCCSVVEHLSANPKVPGSIPGPVSYWGHGL